MKYLLTRLVVIGCALLVLPLGSTGQVLKERGRYVLRPGDTLDLQFRLTPDLDQTVVIQPDGYVSINVAGEVQLAGLTVKQAHDLIVTKDAGRLNNPELNLILKEFTHPSITVAGEVSHPGKIDLKENTSAWSAIMQAGGFSAAAKSGQVLVFRKVDDSIAEVHQLNLSKMKKNSDLEHDMDLQPGDMLYVPRDRISVIQHYMSLTNVGMYFDPTTAFR